MGTGKTAVGKHLAQLLGWNFIDTDILIEKLEGKSITRIFRENGEPYFRDLETKVIDILSDYHYFVVGCGGGMVLKPANAEKLKKIGPLVLLSARPEVILERIKEEKNRPLLQVDNPFQRINELLTLRNTTYHEVADTEVDTSDISVDEVGREILKKLEMNDA